MTQDRLDEDPLVSHKFLVDEAVELTEADRAEAVRLVCPNDFSIEVDALLGEAEHGREEIVEPCSTAPGLEDGLRDSLDDIGIGSAVYAILGQAVKNAVWCLPLVLISAQFWIVAFVAAGLGLLSGMFRHFQVQRLLREQGRKLFESSARLPLSQLDARGLLVKATAVEGLVIDSMDRGTGRLRVRQPGLLHTGAVYELIVTAVTESESEVVLRSILADSITRRLFHGKLILSTSATELRAQLQERDEILKKVMEGVRSFSDSQSFPSLSVLDELPKFDAPVLKGLLWSLGLGVLIANWPEHRVWAFTVVWPLQLCIQMIWTAYLVKITKAMARICKGRFPVSSVESLLNGLIGPQLFTVGLRLGCLAFCAIWDWHIGHPLEEPFKILLGVSVILGLMFLPLFVSSLLIYRFVRGIRHSSELSSCEAAPGFGSALLMLCGVMLPSFAFWFNCTIESEYQFDICLIVEWVVQLCGWTVAFACLRKICTFLRKSVAANYRVEDTIEDETAKLLPASGNESRCKKFSGKSCSDEMPIGPSQRPAFFKEAWQTYCDSSTLTRLLISVTFGLLFLISIEVTDLYLRPDLLSIFVTVGCLAYVLLPHRSQIFLTHLRLNSSQGIDGSASLLQQFDARPTAAEAMTASIGKSRRMYVHPYWSAYSSLPAANRIGVTTIAAICFVVLCEFIVGLLPGSCLTLFPFFVAVVLGAAGLVLSRFMPQIMRFWCRLWNSFSSPVPRTVLLRSAKVFIALSFVSFFPPRLLPLLDWMPRAMANAAILDNQERLRWHDAVIKRPGATEVEYMGKAEFLGNIGLAEQQLATIAEGKEKFGVHSVHGHVLAVEEIDTLRILKRNERAIDLCKAFLAHRCSESPSLALRVRVFGVLSQLLREQGELKLAEEVQEERMRIIREHNTPDLF